MKEVSPHKGLDDHTADDVKYTDEQFEQALSDNGERQARADTDTKPESNAVFPVDDSRVMDTITLMRIYDVLAAILNKIDPEAADIVMERHADGKLIGPIPWINI